jgi:hypothetical protein
MEAAHTLAQANMSFEVLEARSYIAEPTGPRLWTGNIHVK